MEEKMIKTSRNQKKHNTKADKLKKNRTRKNVRKASPKNMEMTRDELKMKRRKARRRMVMIQRLALVVLAAAVIGGGGFAIVWNLPEVRLDRQLRAGEDYTKEAAYAEAVEAYKAALELDVTSVKAYRCMAGAYLEMEDESNAKKILFEGWENTQDESLLQYYCTVILNEAVAEINADEVGFDTAEKIIRVIEQGIMNEDAIPLMDTVYERLMENMTAEPAAFDFTAYEQLVQKLDELYQENPSEEIGKVVSEYAMLDVEELTVAVNWVEAYLGILEKGNAIEELPKRSDLIVCLKKEVEIQNLFADIFTQLDAGNYEAAKEFIVTEEYVALRDAFIGGTMEYWEGETAIPLSREKVHLTCRENQWSFEFPSFKDNETTAGVITVGGADMTDNGVQRTTIAYEPAMKNGDYYPHMEYVISYVYSNVQKKNSFEYEMNYHFETREWTEEGMTTYMIGDWGGPYQWEKTY